MGYNGTLIVGIDEYPQGKMMRIVMYNYSPENFKWNFNKTLVSEAKLIEACASGKIKLVNAELTRTKNGIELNWTTGASIRFTGSHKNGVDPLVIIAELRVASNESRLLGYKVATHEGNIRNIKLSDLLSYCTKVHNEAIKKNLPIVPIQNAIFVEANNSISAHIKPYKENQFVKELIRVNKPTNVSPANVNKKENDKQISKLTELFTADQINELKLGKKNGVDIRMYGNNKLSADQMKQIRLALEGGLNPKPYADPSFKAECMKAYRLQSKYGVDISAFVNPEYTFEQIFEISTGWLSGIDISKIADPKMPVNKMAKERIAMEIALWNEVESVEKEI